MFNIVSVEQADFRPVRRYRRITQTKGRLYLSQKNESVLQNFVLRDSAKPIREYRKHILSQMAAHGINVEGAVWSRNAGCTMCPCSPGFILPNHFKDVWVTFEYVVAPEPKPMTEREQYRASVLTDILMANA